ncbi:hypothetical protein HPB48_004748 [Haemaphysalis longicornis]|uniref:Transient receptor ion channel domain-containing protein n=1 Tax=Haemaphysalis longicornis TaxID=44386 RepID=A0A9J6G1R4_HAELO|nr:hypothetical protein HPB48_004748 [Haemaphysalis longicornis]
MAPKTPAKEPGKTPEKSPDKAKKADKKSEKEGKKSEKEGKKSEKEGKKSEKEGKKSEKEGKTPEKKGKAPEKKVKAPEKKRKRSEDTPGKTPKGKIPAVTIQAAGPSATSPAPILAVGPSGISPARLETGDPGTIAPASAQTLPPSSPSTPRRLSHVFAGVTETGEEVRIVASSTSLADSLEPATFPELGPEELKYFELVESGEKDALISFVNQHPNLNIDCVNCQGYNALQVAVLNKHFAVAKFLIDKGARLKDSLLHAVVTGDLELTLLILKEVLKSDPLCEQRGLTYSATFTADLTPVILAAQHGHWDIIRFFLKKGYTIDAPHKASCMCKTCVKAARTMTVDVSTRNINTYKAICNPYYMIQVSGDPFLDAFLYAQSMKDTSDAEEEYRTAYNEEVAKLRVAGLEGRVEHLAFPRVVLALECYEREFVTHSNVQQVLRFEWEGEFQAWNRLSFHRKLFHFLLRFLMLPLLAVWVKLKPNTATAKHWSSPVSRYLNHFASRILFVFFVFLEIVLDSNRTTRGAPSTGLEWLIVLWVIGYAFEEAVNCYAIGLSRYFRSRWNWYDIVMICLFVLTFIFWIAAWAEVLQDPSKGAVPPRNEWKSFDNTLIHEALFAVSSVLSVFKLMYYFQESAKLGPLQVSITSMMVEIIRFLFMCICIMLAFALGLTRMYAPYRGMRREVPGEDDIKQNPAFTTFPNAMKTLFLRMLGVASEDQADVVVANAKNRTINEHKFTEVVGSAMYSFYQVLMLVALINSLIAIITGTFQKIMDNAEVHWKFYRTRLWMHYINEAVTVPSPFIYLQLPFVILELAKKKKFWPHRQTPVLSFRDVVENLAQRYLCHTGVVISN